MYFQLVSFRLCSNFYIISSFLCCHAISHGYSSSILLRDIACTWLLFPRLTDWLSMIEFIQLLLRACLFVSTLVWPIICFLDPLCQRQQHCEGWSGLHLISAIGYLFFLYVEWLVFLFITPRKTRFHISYLNSPKYKAPLFEPTYAPLIDPWTKRRQLYCVSYFDEKHSARSNS